MTTTRPARLDDTTAISALFRARIGVWQRLTRQGVETLPYDQLTIYERWQHGGAWMSVETGAILLNGLLAGAGVALVAVRDGGVVGYAEGYPGTEPEPFGAHLHLVHLLAADADAADALIEGVIAAARARRLARVTLTRAGGDVTVGVVARPITLTPISALRRFTLPAKQGQIFYRAVDLTEPDVRRIAGWSMPIGRYSSARHQWEETMPRVWETIPEIAAGRVTRMQFSAAGSEAIVYVAQQPYDPRAAQVYLWTSKAFIPQLILSIRDWAHREGYRTLIMAVPDEAVRVLGVDAEDDGYRQETCTVQLA